MIGGDAVFLPLCMMLAVAFRLGSLDAAVHMAPLIQLGVALLALPALGIAGLYRTVVRYIDLRVFVASSAALAAVVLVLSALAWTFEVVVLPRTALPIFWFVAFAYVVTSRFIARSLLRRGMKQAGRHRLRTAIYGAGDAGAQLAQAMQLSPDHLALCFLDDRADLQPQDRRRSAGVLAVRRSATPSSATSSRRSSSRSRRRARRRSGA